MKNPRMNNPQPTFPFPIPTLRLLDTSPTKDFMSKCTFFCSKYKALGFLQFLPPSLANVLFQRYRFWKGFFDIDCWNQSPYFFYYIHDYRGFNKITLMVENSTLRRQFFIVFLRELFCYNEEHFFINKTYYINCFVRGSRPDVFC